MESFITSILVVQPNRRLLKSLKNCPHFSFGISNVIFLISLILIFQFSAVHRNNRARDVPLHKNNEYSRNVISIVDLLRKSSRLIEKIFAVEEIFCLFHLYQPLFAKVETRHVDCASRKLKMTK